MVERTGSPDVSPDTQFHTGLFPQITIPLQSPDHHNSRELSKLPRSCQSRKPGNLDDNFQRPPLRQFDIGGHLLTVPQKAGLSGKTSWVKDRRTGPALTCFLSLPGHRTTPSLVSVFPGRCFPWVIGYRDLRPPPDPD